MIMESETPSTDIADTVYESGNGLKEGGYHSKGNMAPQERDTVSSSRQQNEDEYDNEKENHVGKIMYNYRDVPDGVQSSDDGGMMGKDAQRMVSTDGEADDAEDGEILEDGEIASDQEGEINEDEEEGESEIKLSSNKSSPNKPKGSHKDKERGRKGRNRRDRHSKRRRSQEDNHKEKQQKKKRHREYVDYDKAGDEYEQSWMAADNRRDKTDRKGDRSPPQPYHSPSQDGEERQSHKHDKDGDKHRRGSGEGRHHSGGNRDREKVRDRDHDREKKNHESRGISQDRSKERDRRDKDKHDKVDREKNKKDRDRHNRESKETREKQKNLGESYDSPPGIYDSPSDEEYGAGDNRFVKKPKTMMSMVEGEYMDPSMTTNDTEVVPQKLRKKQQKKKEWQERRRQREMEFEEEAPVKKKPLLQTPMEERPVCRFFKEGKCQKGDDCHFNHDFRPPKRLELCKYHIQNFCRNEETCVFMHGEFPCKYFHTGSTCYQGEKCKFSHDPLTEETEQALQNALNEREEYFNEEYDNGFVEGKKNRYKKGLLGDMPAMSQEQIDSKLEQMKAIPSIFDIETFAPGESPRKPGPMGMGQSPSMIRPHGFYQDNMSPQGPHMRFNGPPNQGTPPRPHFMHGPGMDGPPPGMQGPPPMGGPGLMGPGPPPGMPNIGPPQGPGMQGPPMGPPMNNQPMSQAAALVGAILRAAPMLQQYRGPNPVTSLANNENTDPRFVGQNMMGGQQTAGPMLSPNQGIMSPGQDTMKGPPSLLGQGLGQPGRVEHVQDNMGYTQEQNIGQTTQNLNQMVPNSRDPRKLMNQVSVQEDNREYKPMDIDMREDVDMRTSGSKNDMGDMDLRRDVDLRQEENNNQAGGNTTPQQEWEEDNDKAMNEIDDSDIPAHLPPKQREMFLRIKQHTMIMNSQKEAAKKSDKAQTDTSANTKVEDDKWYSSDEEDDVKPNISNILNTLQQPEVKQEQAASVNNTGPSSSINVMQMINAIKNSTAGVPTTTTTSRDPRKQLSSEPKPYVPPREPTIINSCEGDCAWRLCRVLYVKQRIPDNVDLNDPKFKSDPRVQKMLKLQELESGRIIDHSKATSVSVKSEPNMSNESKLPLLDPKIFQAKEPSLPRPELAPFVDPRAMKKENSEPRIKQEPVVIQRPVDPRVKQELPNKPVDPRIQRTLSNPGLPMQNTVMGMPAPPIGMPPAPSMSVPPPNIAMHNLPVRPMDPRISRQDSNLSNQISMNPVSRPLDPRLARQNSRDTTPVNSISRSSTPPIDPRQFSRQSSIDPRLNRNDTLTIDMGNSVPKPLDPRLGRVVEADVSAQSVQRQLSQPGTSAEKDAASEPPKPKIDYRNDPRYKRKHISESNLSPESSAKRFTGQRKSSTEYSSPLDRESSKQDESHYNSYNRPRPAKPTQQSQPQPSIMMTSDTVPAPSSDITTHDILDSLQIMPTATLEQPAPDKNLKDIFKTIDPTASPFC